MTNLKVGGKTMKKLGFVVTIVFSVLLIITIPSKVHSQQTTITAERWQVFTEPSFGFQIEYPADWYVSLVVDNVNRVKDYGEHVALRSIGFFGPNSQIVFVDIWSNSDRLPLDEWTLLNPFYLDTDEQLTITTQEIKLNNITGRQVTGTPGDELQGIVPFHYRTQFIQNDLIFSIEYDSLSPDLDIYQTLLNSFVLVNATLSQNEPSSLTKAPPPAEYGITVATCCGVVDSEYNPFPCNMSGEDGCPSAPCGNCTWWARYARTGNNEANLYHCTANANTWDECADQYYPHLRSNTPESNAVIVWIRINDNHVAYIEHMNSGTSYYVSQMGWSQTCPERYYNQIHDGSKYTYIRHPDNLDSTPPVTAVSLSGTPGQNGYYVSNVTATFTATDNSSGVASTYYNHNSVGWMTYSPPLIISSNGQNILGYYSIDNAGNTETPKSTAPFYIDTVPPTNPTSISPGCSVTSDVWQNTCSDLYFTWSGASDATSGVTSYAYDWSGGGGGVTNNLYWNPPPVSDGTYTFKIQTKDVAGNWSIWKTMFTLKYDATAPTGSIFIKDNWEVTNQALVSLTTAASDNASGVSLMRLRDMGGTWMDWLSYGSSIQWVLPPQTGQVHTVEVQYQDQAGNLSPIYSDSIYLDIYPDQPSSQNYQLIKSTFGMSATVARSAYFSLQGTLSQVSTTGQSKSENYQNISGYWSWIIEQIQAFINYLPTILK